MSSFFPCGLNTRGRLGNGRWLVSNEAQRPLPETGTSARGAIVNGAVGVFKQEQRETEIATRNVWQEVTGKSVSGPGRRC